MKKSNKDYLYRTIFKLFLSKHYELVTVKDIEEATGMSRGAVFYYSPNKQSLFCDIVDTYFFKAKDLEERLQEIQDKEILDKSLEECIHAYVKLVDFRMKKMEGILNMSRTEASRAYLSFILEAQNYYPKFNEKLTSLFDMELGIWEMALANAQKRGEIKPDIDALRYARIFRYFYVGFCYQTSLVERGVDMNKMETYLMTIYRQIKK